MTLKERYLEENIVKTIDRAIHKDDYEKLRDELQLYRAQTRMLKPEVELLQQQYSSVKNSPQGPALKLALDSKMQDLQQANDKLEMYKDKGRQNLDVDPRDYQLQKATSEGVVNGGLAGLAAGGLGGLAAGHAMFGESIETFSERIIEEAAKTLNPAYSKPLQNTLKKVSSALPKRWGGDAARASAAKIGANRTDLAKNMRNARNQPHSGTDKINPAGRADAASMSINTNPNATKESHPMFKELKGEGFFGSSNPSSDAEIDTLIKQDPRGLFSGDSGRKLDAIASGSEKAASAADAGFKKYGGKANEGIKKAYSSFKSSGMADRASSAAMGSPLVATGLGAGALGLGAMGLSHLFGDGDGDGDTGEVEAPAETVAEAAPTPDSSSTLSNILSKFPGGSTGLKATAGGLGAAGLYGLMQDQRRRNR